MLTTNPDARWIAQNGVIIMCTENNCYAVVVPGQVDDRLLHLEIDYLGRWYISDYFNCKIPYRDHLDVDLRMCVLRVKEGDTILAELGQSPQGRLFEPWMVVQGEQTHITESYVSVPPALHITDETGARWTLGFNSVPRTLAPEGEFAFNVLRDGFDMGEEASRIERRSGKIRIFTRNGWKRWLGREWS